MRRYVASALKKFVVSGISLDQGENYNDFNQLPYGKAFCLNRNMPNPFLTIKHRRRLQKSFTIFSGNIFNTFFSGKMFSVEMCQF